MPPIVLLAGLVVGPALLLAVFLACTAL